MTSPTRQVVRQPFVPSGAPLGYGTTAGALDRADRGTPAPAVVLRRLAVLLLAGYLLFCHGCHGDEDTELFARLTSPQVAAR